jgi:hypothetical protein
VLVSVRSRSHLIGPADVAQGGLGIRVPKYCWMISSGAPYKAMLVPTVWRIVCDKMAFVLPAVRTYFLTLMCC